MMLTDEVTNKVTPLQRDTASQQHLHVEYWIGGYKLKAQKMKKANWTLDLKTMAEIATQFPDPVSTVILHVNSCEQAKRERNVLTTSLFYINATRGKYKFVLIIGFDSNNVIISVSIMKGKHDKFLSWPFTGSIVVTLLNQTPNKNHYSKEIWSATDNPGLTYAGKVPPD